MVLMINKASTCSTTGGICYHFFELMSRTIICACVYVCVRACVCVCVRACVLPSGVISVSSVVFILAIKS